MLSDLIGEEELHDRNKACVAEISNAWAVFVQRE
jgi:hypothetical protein